jgi:hypothetical protein
MNQKLGRRKRRLQMKRRFFHGGVSGLEIGEYILPPSITNRPQNGIAPSHIRRKDRVYVTPSLTDAQLFAAHHPGPLIYEVEPEGGIEDDPDHKIPGISRIIAIQEIPADKLQAARLVLLR